jgi:hypothetical protein
MTEDITIANYLHKIICDQESPKELGDIIRNSDSEKLRLLWEIFFETGIHDLELLEQRIYAYGSELKEKDLLGREVFIALVFLLRQMQLKNNRM